MTNDPVDVLVTRFHEAIDATKELDTLDEAQWLETVLSALDVVAEGFKMRQQEIIRDTE